MFDQKSNKAPRNRTAVAVSIGLLASLGNSTSCPATEGKIIAADDKQAIPQASPSTQNSNAHDPNSQRTYKTWSIFIICNPDWIRAASAQRVDTLLDQFKAFGTAIGPDNLAIWFSKKGRVGQPDKIDFDRSALYCSKLKLDPLKSPYVLLTTQFPGAGLPDQYPDTFPATLGNHFLLSLNEASLDETNRLLGALTNQIITSDLSQLTVNSNEYWSSMENNYISVRDKIGSFVKQITVTFELGPVKTEVAFDHKT
jgi:hypothetical protein